MAKGWKIALIIFVCLLLCGAVVVGAFWYLANKTEPVAVTSVKDHALGYSDEVPFYDGVVSTSNLQSVFLSGTQTVKEIYVTEGQYVEKGAALFRYDTTLTDIQLERQRTTVEQAQLALKNAQEDLEKIKVMKPYTPPPTTRPTTAPTTAPLQSIDDLPYYICGTGTENNPYRYLWSEEIDFDEEFLLEHFSKQQQTECYIAFEIRERNALAGDLLDIWGLHLTRYEETVDSEEDSEEDPVEEPGDGTETEPSEGEDGETETEPTEPGETEPVYYLTYRFFYPEEIEHVERPVATTIRETEWVDTSSGYTAAEIAVMRQEKEKEIRDLDLAARMEKLRFDTMKQEMGASVVTATISGTIVELRSVENALSENTPIMQISEGGTFYVTITLGEYERKLYESGDTATISSWYDYGYTVEGTLVSVSDAPVQSGYYYGSGNPDVSMYEAVLSVPADAKIREGEWVGVSFNSDQNRATNVLYLDNAYIRDENGRSYVYRRNDQGLLEKVYVQTGTIQWGYTAILSGLTEEDWIAFPYGKEVKDGAPTYEDESVGSADYYDDM
ncbi:MAG: HlyD family efflux transporter periplasmic adaptor subunit [Oscillospiraceae bacterium]|nr:HlyD family efflux transporter periplasmic adaptor subunit [Oscillospiraceae bacterium]